MKSAATVVELFSSLLYHVALNHHHAGMSANDQRRVVILKCLTTVTAIPNLARVVLSSLKRRVFAARRLSRTSNVGSPMCAAASRVGAS